MGQLIKNAAGRGRPVPVRVRYLFLLATVCGGSFLIFSISSSSLFFFHNGLSIHGTRKHNVNEQSEFFTIKTEGCTIPGFDPYDKSINRLVTRPPEVICPRANTSLLKNNNTHIWIVSENLQYYDIDPEANLTCCYRSFYRPTSVDDITKKSADDRVQYNPCIYFYSYIEAMHEFVRVSCGNEFKIIYQQYFLFAPLKEVTPIDIIGYEDEPHNNRSLNTLNVIVMGIDAISRLNFHRTMPKTLSFLRRKGAIELLGYNKVGDNTFPNLTPMLLGLRDTELKKTCWPNLKSRFDNCPFIWEWYREAGYLTALGEDSGKLGTFNFGKYGFLTTPTDYYLRTFIREAETRVGNTRDYNSLVCMGNKLFYKVLLDYIEALTTTLKSSRLFGFFWEVTLSHDFLNYPMLMDSSYEALLKHLDHTKYLDETVLILLSDHGIRWGDIRSTKQGRLEERLPFVHILVPPSFKKNYSLAYSNLKINSRRLTTPYDIHATLTDLLHLDELKDNKIKLRSKTAYSNKRSISLFLNVPSNRTCKIADIDDHWCTCHKNIKINTDIPDVQVAAAFLVKDLNMMLRDYPQCSRLVLDGILDASEMLIGSGSIQKEEDGWREILVVIRTTPGGGIFEATLRRHKDQWLLAGTVSRLNLYGDQSHCVNNYQLKLYCYCS
ncbi:uncharacterized protein LOC128683903 isoform X1 [Plodia interpunctella]|uniref:uncharacterized protein LOC128683903 isoform X1 n=1 Tax=Plodia interpunctella TaxID=58824 RepID=UPI002367D290|nr:uncharacterized protein LOC128683903 isoform X1 [Plodia interpunctella]XP_053625970.1 uncharacterized protein LOC128683903 isoform X1 [Plodia interpunctella]XP_053625979.1 uncharacterized protein LOC128683903 isoform X1 [Plodia interpunctella]